MSRDFKIDEYFAYHVQSATGLSTVKILNFFHDLANRVAEMGIEQIKKAGNRGMRKDIRDVFPGTSIPFRLLVKGIYYKYAGKDVEHLDIEVTFPSKSTFVKSDKLSDSLIEEVLLDGSVALPPFDKPKSRTPKMYANLMKEIRDKRLT
jgi:hypothetical protein